MLIRWREFSGRPSERLFERLHRSLGQYQANSHALRVGLTTDPMQTWSERRWEQWSEMVVIYSTSSPSFTEAVGEALVDRGWNNRFTTWNYEAARKDLPGSYTRYYVYVLLD